MATPPERQHPINERNAARAAAGHNPAPSQGQAYYEIRVAGQLERHWSEWFDGLAVEADESGQTILSGLVPDQAALHGLLNKIRDLGLPLLSVICLDAPANAAE